MFSPKVLTLLFHPCANVAPKLEQTLPKPPKAKRQRVEPVQQHPSQCDEEGLLPEVGLVDEARRKQGDEYHRRWGVEGSGERYIMGLERRKLLPESN